VTVADEVREAAAAVLGDPKLPWACDECDKAFSTKFGLGQHRRTHRAAEAPKEAPRVAPSDLVVDEVIGATVANLQTIGGYLSMIMPHAGIAIMGVPGERESDPPIVRSRAIMAGGVLRKWAAQDPRVLQAAHRFNQLFEGSEVVEVAAGLAAAVAVDVGLVDPHLAVEVGPFQGAHAIRPVSAVIGDVVDYVDALRLSMADEMVAARQAPSPDGRAPDGAEVHLGGVTDT
jgi:hypothetical protein